MKAIIPVAGVGTKLRPHTYTQPKALLHVAGKTILSHIVDKLVEGGITEYIFVLGYLGEKIKEFVDKNYPHLTTHYVYQNEAKGTGHAIKLTKEIVNTDEICVVLGDTICEFELTDFINCEKSILGVKMVDDPTKFGVATVNDEGFIESLIEKPEIPKSNLALVGLYKIKETNLLFSILDDIIEDKDSNEINVEYSLTNALQKMLEQGVRFKALPVKKWFDCGRKDTILETNEILLKKAGGSISANNLPFENTIIIQPVSIDDNCTISNAIIGPHVAIGSNTTIDNCIVKDSIIGSFTKMKDVVLHNSLIGNDANVQGLNRCLNIGDNNELDFG